MLVLTRKRGETIKIGSNIVIHVIKTAQGSVKIGIDAPQSVRVVRGELATVEDQNDVDVLFQTEDDTTDPSLFETVLVQC